jgi:hypothetical protein
LESFASDENNRQGVDESWALYILMIEMADSNSLFFHPILARSERAAHDLMYVLLNFHPGEPELYTLN